MKKKKALVVLSGGQDSVTCLGLALKQHEEVEAITFLYGQRHQVELQCASELCKRVNVPHKIVDLEDSLSSLVTSALTGEGDVSAAHPDNKDLPASFVPNRNATFLTLAHAYAQTIKADMLYTGVCQTDFSGYPDCRLTFIEALQEALNIGSLASIEIVTPLMFKTKAETFALAEEVGFLDEVLFHSHTCYEGDHETLHPWGFGCGECPACKIRARGYAEYLASL